MTDREKLVAEAFAEVLGMSRVDPEESFFDLGGTSLDAGKLCARIGTELDIAVPFPQIYRTPSVTTLVDWLDEVSARETPAPVPVAPDEPVPLTTGQLNLVHASPEVVCAQLWWIDGELDTGALQAALTDVQHRHQTLYAHYRPDPPSAVVPADPGTAELVLLPDAADDGSARSTVDSAVRAPLDFTRGRIWRAGLVRSKDSGRLLLGIGVHHLAFDGWSQALLIGDLSRAYSARKAGTAPNWDRPAPTLREVADEWRNRLAPTDLGPQLAYWRGQLRDLPRLAIPGMARGMAAPSGPKDGRLVRLPALSRWDEDAKGRGATRFSYLVAVFGAVLHRITGQPDVAMIVPVALRGSPLLDATIASRLDAVCLRLRRVGRPGTDLLAAARQVLTGALAAQDVSFNEVVGDLARLRPDIHILAGLPIFLLQDNAAEPFTIDGCVLEGVTEPVAKEAPNAITVEVFADPDGAALRVTVRTDIAPPGLADRITREFLDIIERGPARLATPVAAGRAG